MNVSARPLLRACAITGTMSFMYQKSLQALLIATSLSEQIKNIVYS